MRAELLNRLAAECCIDAECGSVSPDVRAGDGRLYGGSSSKKSTSTTSNTTNVDKRQVTDGGSTGLSLDGSGNVITVTDQGAVARALGAVDAASVRAFDLSKTSTEAAHDTIAEALGLVTQAFTAQQANFNKAADVLGQSADGVKEAWTQAGDTLSGNRTIVMLAIGGAAMVALTVFKKKG